MAATSSAVLPFGSRCRIVTGGGVPYTDIDIEAVSQEVAYRLMMSHDRLYALALYEWTEQHFTQNSDTSDAAAGENGCDFPTHNNST